MSFTNNASNLTGKSTTNAFNVIAESLTVNKNTLCKGDLTVLGNTNIGSVSLENATVDNLTVNNFTATNPVPISSGGTGLSTLGAPNQVLTVDPAGTALIYAPPGLTNPATITGTGFLGNPILSLGLEADTGSLGRGFIRTGVAATSGLCLGTSQATVFRLWSNFPSDSNAEISNTNANFTYNSSGTSGVFQVLNGGGSISFTNIGIGTISMATGAGAISLTTGAGATSITTGAGPISLTTGLGNISLTTAGAGIISIETATSGAINIGASVGLVNLYGSGITLGAPVIYIGTGSAVPVPSILTFACGAVNGITGAWAITTAAFQLNALSVTLNSTGTILLNNASTINGDANIIGNIYANASNSASTTVVNPAVFVYSGGGNNWGFDLGYRSSSGRFRTRMFAPTGGDIALSIGSGSNQSDFSDKLIVQGNTGNVQVINGNILTNQNIVGGIEIINSGNLTLTASSPGTILIRGGSGSIITLPDATTLIVGYIYTINNNSNHTVTVNYHTSGTLGSIPPLNAGTVSCIQTSSANGQWDIHITGPTTGTDWATPGQIGSAVPNTGVFTTLSATGNIHGNWLNLISTTTRNPAIYVFSSGVNEYGMDLGYKSSSGRYRTRIFAPGAGDIALSIGSGLNQSDFVDFLIIKGDTGNLEINSSQTIITGNRTEINGTTIDLASTVFQVNNTTTMTAANMNTNIASFLQPLMQFNQSTNMFLGKSVTNFNSAIFQYAYNTTESLRTTSWGFADLGAGGRITLRPNSNTNEQILLTGKTRITGIVIAPNFKNGSKWYTDTAGLTTVPNNSWTNVTNISATRTRGNNDILWIDQSTGFRNTGSSYLMFNCSFSCARTSGGPGRTIIQITINNTLELGQQDVSAGDAVSVSANTYLAPNDTFQCRIYQDSGTNQLYGFMRIGVNFYADIEN